MPIESERGKLWSRRGVALLCCAAERSLDDSECATKPLHNSDSTLILTPTNTNTNTMTTTPSVYIPCSLASPLDQIGSESRAANGLLGATERIDDQAGVADVSGASQRANCGRSVNPASSNAGGSQEATVRTEVVLLHSQPQPAEGDAQSPTPTSASGSSYSLSGLAAGSTVANSASSRSLKKPAQLRQQQAIAFDEPCSPVLKPDAHVNGDQAGNGAIDRVLSPVEDENAAANGVSSSLAERLAESVDLNASQRVAAAAPAPAGRHRLLHNALSLVSYVPGRRESLESPVHSHDSQSGPIAGGDRRQLKVTILGPFGILESESASSEASMSMSASTSVADCFGKAERKHSDSRLRRRTTRECRSVSICDADGYVQLNQYKLKHAIGKGSYSIVKLAYNEEDNTHYAMKILSKSKLMKKSGLFKRPPPRAGARCSLPSGTIALSTPAPAPAPSQDKNKRNFVDPLQRVYHEISILKKLDHKNIVKLAEVLDDPVQDNLYMVFELVQRGAVLEVPTDTPLSEDEAWKYFRDVLLGLEYLHYNNVIHRDLKPSNLLLTDDGHIKIADFGVSDEFRAGDDAQVSSTTGTPAFLAPECLNGQGSYNGKCVDIWSLGVTLYCFIYGNVPFEDQNRAALYEKIMTSPLQLPPTPVVTESLCDLLGRMIEKDPTIRITLGDIKTHRWVTRDDQDPLPSTEENCQALVEVTEEDVKNSIRRIPRIETLILIRSILRQKSFHNPFKNGRSLTPTHSVVRGVDGPF